MTEDKTDERGLVEEWLKKINEAEKVYAKYYELVDETRDFYKDSKGSKSGKYNIFWSSVETLKPFLYFKQPKFYVERSNKNAGKAEKLACEMLENALKWDLEQFDFDSVIKYARNDFLISGAGIVWEQYKPVIETQPDPLDPESEIAVKTGEKVESVYLDPRYFLTDTDRVGVWEDVTWIARKIYMDREAAEEEFDEEFSHIRNLGQDFGQNLLAVAGGCRQVSESKRQSAERQRLFPLSETDFRHHDQQQHYPGAGLLHDPGNVKRAERHQFADEADDAGFEGERRL